MSYLSKSKWMSFSSGIEAIRLKREVTTIRSPGRALVVAGTGGETTRVRAVRAHRPEVVRALSLRVDDRVALRRPARLGVKAGRGDLADVGPVRVHHEEVRLSVAVGHERDLLTRRRPDRLGVDAGVPGEAAQRPRGDREDVDLAVATGTLR